MMIYIDGPVPSLNKDIANDVRGSFDLDKSNVFDHQLVVGGTESKITNDLISGFAGLLEDGYVTIWANGWVQKIVREKYNQSVGRSKGNDYVDDVFFTEWIFGRLLHGRGGKHLILPKTSDDIEYFAEVTGLSYDQMSHLCSLFTTHGKIYGYDIHRWNHQTDEGREDAILEMRKSGVVGLHKVSHDVYVGSRDPIVTFVGDTITRSPLERTVPFTDRESAQFFRPFGGDAIREFGFCHVDRFEELANAKGTEKLVANPIAFGSTAAHVYPTFPEISVNPMYPSANKIEKFLNEYRAITTGEEEE